MLLLPKKVGAFTLLRKLGTGGIAEAYVGTHDEAGGRPVVVRRILPYVLRDPARLASIEARVNDLIGVRHPFLVHVVDHVVSGEDHFIVEEYIDGVTLDKVLTWCRQAQRSIPHNVFLNIATQVCNGLEALHARPGKGTGAESVLHLGLKPGSIFITRDGKVMVGSFGLTRSPTTLPQGGVAGPVPTRMEYLSPEQTHPDQKLTPASDIFSLGAILYELLTTESLFRADSNLQTIHKVRRAEVTSQLLRVKELMPGLDKILYRALSLNPRHRYQRAFVLREDLRGLMSGYSFASIAEDTRTFAAPLIDALVPPTSGVAAAQDAPLGSDGFLDSPDTRIDPDPMTTAAVTAQALQERAARERQQHTLVTLDESDDGREHTESTSPQPIEVDPPTTLRKPDTLVPDDRDRPTIPGTDRAAADVIAREEKDRPTRPGAGPAAPAPRPIGPRRASDLPSESTHYEALAPAMDDLGPAADRANEDPPSVTDKHRPARDTNGPFVSGGTFVPPEAEPPRAVARAGTTAVPTSQVVEAPRFPDPPARAATEPPVKPPPAPALPEPPVKAAPEPPRLPEPPPAATPVPPPPAATPVPPPASVAPLSRPMPPPNLSRPMPAPAVVPTPPPPRPPPATTMDAIGAPRPAAPRPAPVIPASPYEDFEPEPPRGNGLVFGVAAVVALGFLAVCGGASWFGYSWWSARTPVEQVAAAPATLGDDAAALMADAAPPTVEATADPDVDAAAVMAEPTPVDAVPPEAAAPSAMETMAASPSPAATMAASPTAAPAPTPVAAAPAPARTTSVSAAPAPDREIRYEAPPTRTTSSSTRTSTARTAPSYEPEVVAAASPTYKASPTVTTASAPTKTATAKPPPPDEDVVATTPALDVSVAEAPVSTLDQYVEDAKRGKLDGDSVASLEAVDLSDPQYTRSRALLLMNAQKKADDAGTRRYLDQLLKLPENQYSPVYLTDYARWYVNHGEYDKAIERASTAERYWARLPPELVFSKKAEMYEIQAAAWQGKFYKSGGDMEMLDKAIADWERYKRHVATKSRSDLAQRADSQIAKLNDIKARLE